MTIDHKSNKPYAGLSLDLDNEWSYLKAHGDPIWRNFPSYLPVVVPRILSLLAEFDIKITFFIVGKDAEIENNHGALSSIVKAGNDVGNHSQNHEPWMREDASEYEIGKAEELLKKVTGVHPQGFRGPGYSMSNQTLKVLAQRGYSTIRRPFHDSWGLFLSVLLHEHVLEYEAKRGTRYPFRNISRWFKAIEAILVADWRFDTNGNSCDDIPTLQSTFHFSYVLYLSTYSPILARIILAFSITCMRLAGIEPTLLLHSLDFLGSDNVGYAFLLSRMNMRSEVKLGRIRNYLADLIADHTVVSLNQYAEILQSRLKLKIKFPDFRYSLTYAIRAACKTYGDLQ